MSSTVSPSSPYKSTYNPYIHTYIQVMLKGKQSKSADVYAYGIVLWELYTGGRAFADVPSIMLGSQVAQEGRRPSFPQGIYDVGLAGLLNKGDGPSS